ncbi:hypothetical protein NKR23_g10428 [Pleurostoma richardsiae]|uniref:NTF2-like domain-containing protein n=1 Tax=Pleurostoma richardsiae TaxID=41990 RepID=A0AA38VBW8_9PEZI|nr:hypothetical protein NKR23_g10428 [Pleurostoma richardsiae]
MKLLTAIFAATAFACATLGYYIRDTPKDCLTRDEAQSIVDVYQRLIANYTSDDCDKYCADEFVDVSDSINTFLNQPLGGPTFATKEIFMEAQTYNPPFPLVVESVDAVDCDVIALQWHAAFGEANKTSKGITILHNTKEKGYWQIKDIYVEFNSLTWLLDMGGSYVWEG